jgi:hypothetical protein
VTMLHCAAAMLGLFAAFEGYLARRNSRECTWQSL